MRKIIRVLPVLAASLIFCYAAVRGSKDAALEADSRTVQCTVDSAFVEGDLDLELTSGGDNAIYYTLDGSVPTLDSMLYEGNVFLQADDEVQSCVLRARTYNETTGEWGDIFTHTYFYAEDMQTIQDRFSTYIVCVTSDPYNLYDYEYGIMVEGKIRDEYKESEEYISGKLTQPANFTQQGREWERDAYVEIYSPAGEELIAQDAGIRIFGHASRQYYYKSFKLIARDSYGKGSFDYPFFSDNLSADGTGVQDSYKKLVVRAHGFDKSVTLFREELFQRLCSQIEGIDTKSVAPASVWLNGAYYNFEWLQEVYDDVYMEENYGLRQEGDYYSKVTLRADKPTIDVTADEDAEAEEPEEVTENDVDPEDIQATKDYLKVAAYAEKDLTDDRTFEELCQLIDMDNLLQYFAIETYIANWDWPLNNVKLYRYYSSNGMYGDDRQDGRWRYLYYDMEVGFNIFNEPEEDWLTIADVLESSSLFSAVMKRTDCQEQFAEYLQLCIQEYFTEENVRAAIEKLKSERDQELAESFAYKHSMDETYTLDMEEVEQNLEVIYDFVEKRPEMIREQVQELFGILIDE